MSMIRAATQEDAPAVCALWNEMIRDTLATFTTQEKTSDEIKSLIAARAGAFWVAESAQVDGFTTFGPFRAGPGYSATAEHTIILSQTAPFST